MGESEFQKSAALPLLCSARRSYAWLSRRWLTRSATCLSHVAVRPRSPYERPRAALHNMMHAAASFGKAMVCGIPRCGGRNAIDAALKPLKAADSARLAARLIALMPIA